MGVNQSRWFPITYEDALKKVTDAEKRRLEDAYRRFSSNQQLSRQHFRTLVLGEAVPRALADAIFSLYCSNNSLTSNVASTFPRPGSGIGVGGGGISFKDLFTLLVLITKGSKEEKVKFLFGLLSTDGQIDKSSIIRSLTGFDPEFQVCDLSNLFASGDKVSFEGFSTWIDENKASLSIVQWLLFPSAGLSLVSKVESPTFYQTLAGVTHLEEQEIIELERRYQTLVNCSPNNRIDFETLKPMVSPPLPQVLAKSFFLAFDENQDGHIDFKELSCGISAACRGPDMERMKFCFKIFDCDRDGVLNLKEIEALAACLVEVQNQNGDGRQLGSQEQAVIVTELTSRYENGTSPYVSQEEFLVWTVNNQYAKVFASLVYQLSHVVLGLRPLKRRDEGEIVREWLRREENLPPVVGSIWHLINIDWWTNWHAYVNYQDSFSCGHDTLVSRKSNRKTPSIDSTLASDNDRNVVGKSYQQLPEETNSLSGSLGRVKTPSAGSSSGSSSRLATPSESPRSSRKSSSVISAPQRPGKIDNSCLVQQAPAHGKSSLTAEGGKLRPGLSQGKHFELIPERLWKALAQWYGGAPSLPRQIIRNGDGKVELELNPLNIRLFKHQVVRQNTLQGAPPPAAMYSGYTAGLNNTTNGLVAQQQYKRFHAFMCGFSRRTNIGQISEYLATKLQCKQEELRLWHYVSDQMLTLLDVDNACLEDLGVRDNDCLLVELQSKDASWPEEIMQLQLETTNGIRGRRASTFSSSQHLAKGIIGLNNLGNTCYMNAALQCLASTRILARYLTQDCHLYELNRSSLDGMKGHIAKRFGDLVKDMWVGSETSTIAPIKLRYVIGLFRKEFAGVGQQDSQELLAVLLDGLHEDLNRVTDKPYVELEDSDGRPDPQVAKEAWDDHLRRNKSVIVDLFHGQLKSKVTCKTCSHESVRFDSFSTLSLHLPMESNLYLEIIVIKQDSSVPVKYGLTLPMESRYSSIKKRVSHLCSISPDNLILVEVSAGQLSSIESEERNLKGLKNGHCMYVYEWRKQFHLREKSAHSPSFSEIQRREHKIGNGFGGDEASRPRTPNKNGETKLQKKAKGKTICISGISSCFKSEPGTPGAYLQEGQTDNSPEAEKLTGGNIFDTSSIQSRSPLSSRSRSSPNQGPFTNGDLKNRSLANGGLTDSISSSLSSPGSRMAFPEDIASCQHGMIIAMHRKMIPQDVYFLASERYKPTLFGLPVIVPCFEETTCQDLYESIWRQVSRLVSPLPPKDSTHNHALDCDDSMRYEYPFTLKTVQKNGCWCSREPWHRFCRGCVIPCDANRKYDQISDYLAIDWDQTALHLRYLPGQEKAFTEDISVQESWKAANEPITLKKCLESFTTEEHLGEDEKYFCSNCKKHQIAKKKMQIWRLPPVLIVHLKRFHQVNATNWIKSYKVVDFPFNGLDLSDFLAAVPSTTLKRYKSLLRRNVVTNPQSNKLSDTIEETSEPSSLDDSAIGCSTSSTMDKSPSLNSQRRDSLYQDVNDVMEELGNATVLVGQSNDEEEQDVFVPSTSYQRQLSKEQTILGRQRMQSTSLMTHPVNDENLLDFHEHKLEPGKNPLDVKYNLFSMVCHSGNMNSGHYIAYCKSDDGKWYCQNDSSCKEIPEERIEKTTAYILFYEREGLSVDDYLPKMKEGNSPPATSDMDEEFEAELKKQCSVM